MRLTPTMATSGWLITGVDDDAAERAQAGDGDGRAAEFVARRLAAARAASARRATSAAVAHRSCASAWRNTGTISPSSVCVAMPMMHGAVAACTTPASSSKRALTCGNSRTASTIARIRNGSTVSAAALARPISR